MNLSKKLVSGFLALSVFSVIVGYVGFVSMKYVDSGIKSLENETIPAINLLKDAKIAAMQVFAATMDFAQARNNTREYIGDAARIQSKAEFISSVEAYRAIIGEPFLEDGEPRDEIKENAAAFIGASDRMFLLKNSGTKDTEIAEAGETLEYARAKLFVSLDSALKHKSEEIKYRGEAVNTTINRSLVSILIIIIVSMISAILSGIIFAHSIADPVIELTRASEEMSGDYRNIKKIVEGASDDEIGKLTHSFNCMVEDITKRDEEISIKNKKLEASKKELEEKVAELERFNKIAVGRELKMIELKKRINELESMKR